MLLDEFLKAHRRIDEQEATIARFQKQIDAVTAGLQKVSAQLAAASPPDGGLELSKSAPQAVLKQSAKQQAVRRIPILAVPDANPHSGFRQFVGISIGAVVGNAVSQLK